LIEEQLGGYMGLNKGEALEQYSQLIALGRVEEPENVAPFVSHLVSKDSDYMTGQSVMIDGGLIFSQANWGLRTGILNSRMRWGCPARG